jgi:SPP1 family predicted phage head-tail adaptor
MKAGPARTILSAQEPYTVPDGEGGEVVQWRERHRFWAQVHPLTARERLTSDQLIVEGDTRITAQWTDRASRIHETWRLVDVVRGTIYDIKSVIDKDLRRRDLEIMATRGANRG